LITIGLRVSFPRHHLLKIVYFGEFLIISSISECTQSQEREYISLQNKIECRWFTFEEAMSMDENKFVPGIKSLIPEAFILIRINFNE
jgi:hypothetical protein